MKRLHAAAVLGAAAIVCVPGCAETIMITGAVEVAKFGTAAFTNDTLESVFPQNYEWVKNATRKMVEDLELKVLVDRPQDGFLYMETRDLTGEAIYLRVKSRTPDITSVRIQVGWMGNQPYSTMLMSRIELHLKPTAPEVSEAEDAKPAEVTPGATIDVPASAGE